MAITFDGATKVATLSAGTTAMGVRDLWSRWVDWWLTSDNSKYPLMMEQVGGNDIDAGAGTKIPIYAFLLNGWKIKPQEANHTLAVTDGILLVNGGGDPFSNTAGSFIVRINYQQPVQAISFTSGGGGGGGATAADVWAYGDRTLTEEAGLTVDQAAKLDELWRLAGLDAANPMTVTPTTRVAGDIDLELTGDPETSVTVTRQ